MEAKLIDNTNADLLVVNAARVSFGKYKTEIDDKDIKLINYLAKHNHKSPFFHPIFSAEIEGMEDLWDMFLEDQHFLAGMKFKQNVYDDTWTMTGSLYAWFHFQKGYWNDDVDSALEKLAPNAYSALLSNDEYPCNDMPSIITNFRPAKDVYTVHVKAPIFVARQLAKHQVGMCLTGDTEVTFVRKNKGTSNGRYTKTLEELYTMWSGSIKYQGGEKGKRNVRGHHLRVFNELTQRFETSHIVDVIYQGVKPVYTVTTSTGTFKSTLDHKVLTNRGWQEVQNLSTGDIIFTQKGHKFDTLSYNKDRNADRVFRNRIEKEYCSICDSTDNLEVDHIIPVWKAPNLALDNSNLQVLCRVCHKNKTNLEASDRHVSTLLPKYGVVEAVVYYGQEDVYDLSVEGIHNFIANDHVVHNCWNEISGRYVELGNDIWEPEVWRGQTKDKKQGSSEEVALETAYPYCDIVELDYWDITELTKSWYGYNYHICNEQRRAILPLATYTEWYWTGHIDDWNRVFNLRLTDDTQKETREMVQKIYNVIYPTSGSYRTTD